MQAGSLQETGTGRRPGLQGVGSISRIGFGARAGLVGCTHNLWRETRRKLQTPKGTFDIRILCAQRGNRPHPAVRARRKIKRPALTA